MGLKSGADAADTSHGHRRRQVGHLWPHLRAIVLMVTRMLIGGTKSPVS
jgi:hypothetical protein